MWCVFSCQSGAVGRGLDCQLSGWRIKFPSCVKLTKSLQQAFNPKRLLGLSDRDLNLEAAYTTITSWTHWACVKAAWCCKPGPVALCIPLTVPEVLGTENWVTSNLPFLLDPSSIAKMQSQSLLTDSRLLLS